MFKFTADYLIKKAWSKAIKTEIQRLYQDKPAYPNFPEDEAKLDSVMTTLESWLPAGLGTKVKPYLIYLCKKLFQAQPEFQISENGQDEDGIQELLAKHREKFPTGPDSDCGQFRKTIAELKSEIDEEAEVERPGFTPEDMAIVNAGATVIAHVGDWELYKCDEQTKGAAAIKAMGRLCNNSKTGVTWCTGEDRGPATTYINNGPFYVALKGGRTRYALAHQKGPNQIDIIPPENVVVWTTGDEQAAGRFTNLEAVSVERGVDFDFSTISSIPAELVPLLTQAETVDPHLAEMVPIPPPFDKDQLKALVRVTPQEKLVEDWNRNSSNDKGRVQTIMAVSIDLRQELKDVYDKFNTETLNSYIISLAAAGYTSLPKSLEDFIVDNF